MTVLKADPQPACLAQRGLTVRADRSLLLKSGACGTEGDVAGVEKAAAPEYRAGTETAGSLGQLGVHLTLKAYLRPGLRSGTCMPTGQQGTLPMVRLGNMPVGSANTSAWLGLYLGVGALNLARLRPLLGIDAQLGDRRAAAPRWLSRTSNLCQGVHLAML